MSYERDNSSHGNSIDWITRLDVDRDQFFEQLMGAETATILLTLELTKYQLLFLQLWMSLNNKQKVELKRNFKKIIECLPDVNKTDNASPFLTHFRYHVLENMHFRRPSDDCYFCRTRIEDDKKNTGRWHYSKNLILSADEAISRISLEKIFSSRASKERRKEEK